MKPGHRFSERAWLTRVTRASLAATMSALLISGGAAGEEQLSLGEALTRALADGADARIARLETDRAGAGLGEARAGYLPQVGLTSEAGWSNRYNDKMIALDQNLQPKEYSLATIGADRAWLNLYVTQTLLDLRKWREIEREQLATEVAHVAETRKRDDVAYEVLHSFAQVVETERKTAVAEARIEDSDWLAEQAESLHGAGRALEMDRDLVRLHRTDTELAARALADESRSANADLWLAIGEEEPRRLPVDGGTLPFVDPQDAAYGAIEAVPSSPELRILDLRRRMQDASVAAAKAGRLPTMKFVSGYSNYGPKRYDAYKDELWVGVDIAVPIFDGLKSSNEIRGAERDAEIARLRYKSTLKEKRANVRELIRRLETGEERLKLAREREAAAREQVRIADLNLKAERGDLRGAVEARERHTQLALAAIDAEFAQLDDWAQLERELGRLAFSILGPVAKAETPSKP